MEVVGGHVDGNTRTKHFFVGGQLHAQHNRPANFGSLVARKLSLCFSVIRQNIQEIDDRRVENENKSSSNRGEDVTAGIVDKISDEDGNEEERLGAGMETGGTRDTGVRRALR